MEQLVPDMRTIVRVVGQPGLQHETAPISKTNKQKHLFLLAIPTLEKLRQDNCCKLEASLGYRILRLSQNK